MCLYATKSLYAAWMAHFAWNWTMAVVFHTAVSGYPMEAPGYRYVDAGPDWATGGDWGPEGGIPAALGMGAMMRRFRIPVVATHGARMRAPTTQTNRRERMAERVAVIGAGQMGNGIAHVFAQSGFDVTMIDVSADALERGRDTIAANLDRQIKKGTLQAADKDAILGRVSHRAVARRSRGSGARRRSRDGEPRPQVQDLLRPRRRRAGGSAILATNTSSISITEIAARTKRPDKVIGMHFMNPVPVMQLVEVIRGLATSDETTRACSS